MIRRVWRFFMGRSARPRPFTRLREAGLAAAFAVPAFYVVFLVRIALSYEDYEKLFTPGDGELWPLRLLYATGLHAWPALSVGLVLLPLPLAIAFPFSRLARGAAFVSILLMVAAKNSLAYIGHNDHFWILAAFALLVLCPSPRASARRFAYEGTMAFALARALVAVSYFCSAVHKLEGLWACRHSGECAPLAATLSYMMASESANNGLPSPLGHLLIGSPFLNLAGFFGVIAFQLSAPWLAARPRLVPLFGALAALFHLGGWLFLRVNFNSAIACLLVICGLSYPWPWVRRRGICPPP